MNLANTGCCAVTEITDLSDHKLAPDAMKAFCEEVVGNWERNAWPIRVVAKDEPLHLGGFYIFTGVVEQKERTGKGRRPTYGQNFAAFIRRHRLGHLTESVAVSNRLHHPNHLVKVWVWSPAPRNLNRWWKDHRKG